MKEDEIRNIVNNYAYAIHSEPCTKNQLDMLETILLRELAPVDFLLILENQPIDVGLLRSFAKLKGETTKVLTAAMQISKKKSEELVTNRDALTLYHHAISGTNGSGHLSFVPALASVTSFGPGSLATLERYLFEKKFIPQKTYSMLIEAKSSSEKR